VQVKVAFGAVEELESKGFKFFQIVICRAEAQEKGRRTGREAAKGDCELQVGCAEV
jgi:hypothetical protein